MLALLVAEEVERNRRKDIEAVMRDFYVRFVANSLFRRSNGIRVTLPATKETSNQSQYRAFATPRVTQHLPNVPRLRLSTSAH